MSSSSSPTHVLIVGAGVVGCFYGSRIHNPSANVFVSLICRSNYSAIASSGVTLETHTFGNYHFTPHRTFSSIAQAGSSGIKWNYVVVTTKALPDVVDDSETILPLVTVSKKDDDGSGSCIVLIQNGVGVEEPHRIRFPHNPIISAVTVISAEQTSLGVIRQNRWTRISLGPFYTGSARPSDAASQTLVKSSEAHTQMFSDLLGRGGIKDAEVHTELELQQIRWHKLTINAAMNPSAVLSGGCTNGFMVADADLREHLKGIMEEIWNAVPHVLGSPFSSTLAKPEKVIKSNERNVHGKPSMLQDWEAGRPMELEVILGNPIRIAKRAGAEMPRLQSLYALLKMAQKKKLAAKKQQQQAKSKL